MRGTSGSSCTSGGGGSGATLALRIELWESNSAGTAVVGTSALAVADVDRLTSPTSSSWVTISTSNDTEIVIPDSSAPSAKANYALILRELYSPTGTWCICGFQSTFGATATSSISVTPTTYFRLPTSGSTVTQITGNTPNAPIRVLVGTIAPTPSVTRSPTASPTSSRTGTNSFTPTPSNTPSVTATTSSTGSFTPTVTGTPSITPSVTPTRSDSPSATASQTVTPSGTPSTTDSPSGTASGTPTGTPSTTNSLSNTVSATPTPTPSETPSVTPTELAGRLRQEIAAATKPSDPVPTGAIVGAAIGAAALIIAAAVAAYYVSDRKKATQKRKKRMARAHAAISVGPSLHRPEVGGDDDDEEDGTKFVYNVVGVAPVRGVSSSRKMVPIGAAAGAPSAAVKSKRGHEPVRASR